MRKQSAIGAFLLLLVFSVLTTCQLQLNQSKGLSLRVVVPSSISSSTRNVGALTAAKDIASPGGATVVVTIQTQAGEPWAISEPIPTNGKTSVDFAFPFPPAGSYQASAKLLDASGNLLSQAGPTPFSVPSSTNPIVLAMPSNLLSLVAIDSYSGNAATLSPTFSPTTYSGYSANFGNAAYLTLTTVDPNATISVMQAGVPISVTSTLEVSNSSITIVGYGPCELDGTTSPVYITVSAADGTASTTYSITMEGD